MFPPNEHHLLHKIFTILAYMFRFQGPSSGQLYKNTGILSRHTYKHYLWCVAVLVLKTKCVCTGIKTLKYQPCPRCVSVVVCG
jgi:hypothetical protein